MIYPHVLNRGIGVKSPLDQGQVDMKIIREYIPEELSNFRFNYKQLNKLEKNKIDKVVGRLENNS